MSNTKRYGLILPDKSKPQPTFQASRNVFGNDSDSDEELKKKPVLLRPSANNNRQTKITQEKAVSEDPTVYQYDEIYDAMITKKEEKNAKTKEVKKPKYIDNLLKAANKRKIETERRIERQIQKEREKEGDEFADKEVFVTSAYKKKLEEMSLEEEREKREEYLESIGDVTKQRDLGGFYRHLYEQKLGSDKANKDDISKVSAESMETVAKDTDKSKKRNYRKRKSSLDKKQLSEGEIEDSDDEINRVNLEEIRIAKKSKNEENIDADSDFSIDESSDESDSGKKEDSKTAIEPPQISIVQDSDEKTKSPTKNKGSSNDEVNETSPKPKIDIWKKRTVGAVFDEALKRYYERKSTRG